jgi:hypothetical protein
VINFAATTSHDGYPCHYFGTRLSTCGTTLHCVGVFTQWGLFERTYDSEGRRLSWDHGKAKYFVDELGRNRSDHQQLTKESNNERVERTCSTMGGGS